MDPSSKPQSSKPFSSTSAVSEREPRLEPSPGIVAGSPRLSALQPNPASSARPATSYPQQPQHAHHASKQSVKSLSQDLKRISFGTNAMQPPKPLEDFSNSRTASPSNSRPTSRPGSSSPAPRSDSGARSRPTSAAFLSPASNLSPAQKPSSDATADGKLHRRRKSWLPEWQGLHSRKSSRSLQKSSTEHNGQAWTLGPEGGVPYDLTALKEGKQIVELWDDNGDAKVYLFPKESGKGPSFKVPSASFTASRTLTWLAFGNAPDENEGRRPSFDESPPLDPERERELDRAPVFPQLNSQEAPANDLDVFIPVPLKNSTGQGVLSSEDIDVLVSYRNLFAFLTGQTLVGTPTFPTVFSVLVRVGSLLSQYQFSNYDGTTFGEEPELKFRRYCEEFQLADIRNSREMTIEGLVLGERLRSADLYRQSYIHAVGKFEELLRMHSPKFELISQVVRNRLERSSMELATRVAAVQRRLDDFYYPSLFTGIANSQTSDESKFVDFSSWETAFFSCRRFVMTLYKKAYGAWPPKSTSKKNQFAYDGLNRILLLDMYDDFTGIYNMLVNRDAVTTRTMDMQANEVPVQEQESQDEAIYRVLRKLLSEFDRSSPPVQPPIPFDVPLLPSISSIKRDFDQLSPEKQAKERCKRMRSSDINFMLMQSYNRSDLKPSPFVESFIEFERGSAHGKSEKEIRDLRIGQWIFMYVVIQTLPLLIIDAPGVSFHQGVEYFLSMSPRGGLPWAKEEAGRKMNWYSASGGQNVVSLPQDVVENSIEGIYQRSHCWRMAEKWTAGNLPDIPPPVSPPMESPGLGGSVSSGVSQHPDMPFLDERPSSASNRMSKANFPLGLEALPLPPGVNPDATSRPMSVHNPNISFNDILKGQQGKKK